MLRGGGALRHVAGSVHWQVGFLGGGIAGDGSGRPGDRLLREGGFPGRSPHRGHQRTASSFCVGLAEGILARRYVRVEYGRVRVEALAPVCFSLAFPEALRRVRRYVAGRGRSIVLSVQHWYAPHALPFGKGQRGGKDVLGKDALAIPYVNKVTNVPFPQLTVEQVANACISDLLEAEELLRETDPIGPNFEDYSENYTNSGIDNAEYDEDGGFLRYRRERMNYYAVTTTLARIYLYIEDNENAFDWAELAVNTGKCSSTSYIFSLYSDKLSDYSDYYFNPNLEKEEQLIIEVNKKDTIYETDKYGSIDSRLKEWFNYYPNSSTEFVSKYMKSSDGSTPVNIALIRGCEAYYIAAEAASNIEDAYERLNRVRQAFGISATYDLQAGVEDLNKELFAEYQKSFVAEGQLFYYMKRKNFSQISGVSGVTFPALYTFPIPDTEIEFGNISD